MHAGRTIIVHLTASELRHQLLESYYFLNQMLHFQTKFSKSNLIQNGAARKCIYRSQILPTFPSCNPISPLSALSSLDCVIASYISFAAKHSSA